MAATTWRLGTGGRARRSASSRGDRVGSVGRRIAVRVVELLAGRVGPRVGQNEGSDVVGLLVAQRSRPIERHVPADEGGGGLQARHPGADGEGARTPGG